ncbi:hypothetical protein [Streptomyces sp. NPDC005969]|uniref:hypothetical protein n=1 Tax=Streptomyces sp. NPDC005969 TaxID=3156722 RepID=UPI0034000047
MSNQTDALMYDAIESSLWQNLADALNRIEEYGLDPIAGLAEKLGAKPGTATTVIDAGDVIHGGGVRPAGQGYLLRWRGMGNTGPNGEDLPSGWTVTARSETAEGNQS